jgi:hypothetical protein
VQHNKEVLKLPSRAHSKGVSLQECQLCMYACGKLHSGASPLCIVQHGVTCSSSSRLHSHHHAAPPCLYCLVHAARTCLLMHISIMPRVAVFAFVLSCHKPGSTNCVCNSAGCNLQRDMRFHCN